MVVGSPETPKEEPTDVRQYQSREEYDAAMEAVRTDESLSGGERDEILKSGPEPEETFEEYIKRQKD